MWTSTQPGVTILPTASSSVEPRPGSDSATATIVSPRMPTSPTYRPSPLPSTIVPPRITRSYSAAAAAAGAGDGGWPETDAGLTR